MCWKNKRKFLRELKSSNIKGNEGQFSIIIEKNSNKMDKQRKLS